MRERETIVFSMYVEDEEREEREREGERGFKLTGMDQSF